MKDSQLLRRYTPYISPHWLELCISGGCLNWGGGCWAGGRQAQRRVTCLAGGLPLILPAICSPSDVLNTNGWLTSEHNDDCLPSHETRCQHRGIQLSRGNTFVHYYTCYSRKSLSASYIWASTCGDIYTRVYMYQVLYLWSDVQSFDWLYIYRNKIHTCLKQHLCAHAWYVLGFCSAINMHVMDVRICSCLCSSVILGMIWENAWAHIGY